MKTKRVLAGLFAGVWAFAFVACENDKTGNGGMPQSKTIIDLYSFLQPYENDFVTIEDLQEALAEGYVDSAILTKNGCEIYGDDLDEPLVFGEASTCAHEFSDFIVRKSANCTEFGYLTQTCSLCRATQFLFVKTNGHYWELDEVLGNNNARYVCTVCGVSKTDLHGGGHNTGNENIDSTKEILRIINQSGADGAAWLEQAVDRFEEKYADVSFSDGTKGVYVVLESTTNMTLESMPTSNYQLYFARPSESISELAQMGLLADISDVVCERLDGEDKSIQDKMHAATRSSCMAIGKYYALPHYESYAGLTYDVDLFEDENLFFADGESGNYYTSQFGGAHFVQSEYDRKSCGPDGIYDTQDDGLPSSLEELLILCDYMKQGKDITPFTFAGAYPYYSNMLVSALWASLAGADEMKATYTLDSNGTEIDVITGYVGEEPICERVVITPENAYKLYDSVARYYATAFMEIAENEGWFSDRSYQGSCTHKDAQSEFILNGLSGREEIGMLIEGSWWHNEATTYNIFQDYAVLSGSGEERNLAWMSLPAQVYDSVTEGNGREQTLVNVVSSYAFINENVDERAENICKEFLRFLYTDEELQYFTQETGMRKAVEYDLTADQISQMTTFEQSVYFACENSEVVYEMMDNYTYIANRAMLNVAWNSEFYRPRVNGTNYGSFIQAIREGRTAAEIFEATRISQSQWNEIING
ncbi:MAG: extracellular solute-binding protein [Clostridia bacterium]|nr:extracellular solute-binding protein [Clostridia bacterium]